MKTSEVLNRAADIIEERGWRQGGGDVGALCASNAISVALGVTHYSDAHMALMRHLGFDPNQQTVSRIFDWNDSTGRTAGEVIEVLRAAAVIEAAREEQDAAWETYAELVTA